MAATARGGGGDGGGGEGGGGLGGSGLRLDKVDAGNYLRHGVLHLNPERFGGRERGERDERGER